MQNVEPDNNCSEFEDNEENAMEIDSKSAVDSGEALATLGKLQVLFEENDAENEVLRSLTSLTKKVEEMRIESKKQKSITDSFQMTFFVRMNVNLNKSIGKEKLTI